MSAFFCKKQYFLVKIVPLLKSIVWICVRYFLVLFSGFVRWKVIVNENLSFVNHTFGIRLPDGCKLAINWEKENDVTICWHDAIVKLFLPYRTFLLKFSYWSKFHVNIMNGSGVMTVFIYKKDWPEIRKLEIPTSGFCLISEDGIESGIPNLVQMFLIKC